jgi:hypothetical protein
LELTREANQFAHSPFSLDHLVGAGEQSGRDVQAECLRHNQVNDEVELGRLLDRQIGGLLALENPGDIEPRGR